jgi:hypothetical protein
LQYSCNVNWDFFGRSLWYGRDINRFHKCDCEVLDKVFLPSSRLNFRLTKRLSVGEKYNIDPRTILATSHGRRSIDVFKEIDPSNANWECRILTSPSLKICSLIMLRR